MKIIVSLTPIFFNHHPRPELPPIHSFATLQKIFSIVFTYVAGIVLLLCDLFLIAFPHWPISVVPLLFIGVAYLGFQMIIKPTPLDLFKALIISSAFILWGVDQLLPAGWSATTLGDVVITLYVVDLGWVMLDRLKQNRQSKILENS